MYFIPTLFRENIENKYEIYMKILVEPLYYFPTLLRENIKTSMKALKILVEPLYVLYPYSVQREY